MRLMLLQIKLQKTAEITYLKASKWYHLTHLEQVGTI